MKATLFLRKDHESLQSLLKKDNKLAELRREFEMHSRLEQELFYPELQNSASPEAADMATRAIGEHQALDALLQELATLGPQNKQFGASMDLFIQKLQEHLEFEEDQLFDEARRLLSEYRLEELGLEMEERRKFLHIAA